MLFNIFVSKGAELGANTKAQPNGRTAQNAGS